MNLKESVLAQREMQVDDARLNFDEAQAAYWVAAEALDAAEAVLQKAKNAYAEAKQGLTE